jgi:hypothetical protein
MLTSTGSEFHLGVQCIMATMDNVNLRFATFSSNHQVFHETVVSFLCDVNYDLVSRKAKLSQPNALMRLYVAIVVEKISKKVA